MRGGVWGGGEYGWGGFGWEEGEGRKGTDESGGCRNNLGCKNLYMWTGFTL